MEGNTVDKIDLLRADTFQPVSAQPQSFSEYLSKPHTSDDTRRSDNEVMCILIISCIQTYYLLLLS